MAKRQKSVTEIIPEEFASALAEAITPVAPPAARASELKSRVMARIRGKKSFDLMTVRAEEGVWITLLPGVEKKILCENLEEGQIQSYLLRMAPGTTLPAHEHMADEECLMLEGEAMIGDIHLSAGDYHFARKGSKHGLITTQTGALAFLRAYEPLD
jgi:quercetin dioxygenase-like cupin family protein